MQGDDGGNVEDGFVVPRHPLNFGPRLADVLLEVGVCDEAQAAKLAEILKADFREAWAPINSD